MKLATIANGTRDGALVVISRDGERYLEARETAPTLQAAVDSWADTEPKLRALAATLDQRGGSPAGDIRFLAPLPRAWQWLDGSAFKSHGDLMERVLSLIHISEPTRLKTRSRMPSSA